MFMMESSNTKANILFLLGKEMDQGKLRGMQMNKATMQIITRKQDRFLGGESGAEDDIP